MGSGGGRLSHRRFSVLASRWQAAPGAAVRILSVKQARRW
ncbi:hypothetical protein GWL_22060 [Herbaspirillum sp. GW103]|nr:hypothetical protein GWL_22060 [Herbaspirillum sp. GW103]